MALSINQATLQFELAKLASVDAWRPGEGSRSIRGEFVTLRFFRVRKQMLRVRSQSDDLVQIQWDKLVQIERDELVQTQGFLVVTKSDEQSDDRQLRVELQIDPLAPLMETSDADVASYRIAQVILSAHSRSAISSSAKQALKCLNGPRLSRSDLEGHEFVLYERKENSLLLVEAVRTDADGRARTKGTVRADATLCVFARASTQPQDPAQSSEAGKLLDFRQALLRKLRESQTVHESEGGPVRASGTSVRGTGGSGKNSAELLTVQYPDIGEPGMTAELVCPLDGSNSCTLQLSTKHDGPAEAQITVTFGEESQVVRLSRTDDGGYCGRAKFNQPLDMLLGTLPAVYRTATARGAAGHNAHVESGPRTATTLACFNQLWAAAADSAAVMDRHRTNADAPERIRLAQGDWRVAIILREADVTFEFSIDKDVADTACARFRVWARGAENEPIDVRLVALPLSKDNDQRHGRVTLPRSSFKDYDLDELALSLEVLDPDNVSEAEVAELRRLVDQIDPSRQIYNELKRFVYLLQNRGR